MLWELHHVMSSHVISLVRLFLDYTYYYSTYIQYNNTMYNYIVHVRIQVWKNACYIPVYVHRYIHYYVHTNSIACYYNIIIILNFVQVVHYTAAASAGAGFYTMHNAHAYHSYCIHNITINCSTIPLSVGHMHNTPMWNRSNIEYIKQ